MIKYLIDASVAIEFYRPKSTFKTKQEYIHNQNLLAYLTKQKTSSEVIIFIPSFCIAEVKNTLSKWFFRHNNVFNSRAHYKTCFNTFISHIRDRKFFYSYDLNRYHNLNVDEITEVEHTTQTEFQVTGSPIGTDIDILNNKLKDKNSKDHVGRYYLSSFDILIIAMGMELKRIHGDEIHLLTGDKRLALISSNRTDIFPKSYYWKELKVSNLPI